MLMYIHVCGISLPIERSTTYSMENLRITGVLPEHPNNSILMDIQPYHVLGWTLTNTTATRLMKRWYTTEWRSVLAVNSYRDEWNVCQLDTSCWCKGQYACLEDCWGSEARVRSQLWSPEDGFVKSCLLVSTTYVYDGINNGSRTCDDAQDMAVTQSNVTRKF